MVSDVVVFFETFDVRVDQEATSAYGLGDAIGPVVRSVTDQARVTDHDVGRCVEVTEILSSDARLSVCWPELGLRVVLAEPVHQLGPVCPLSVISGSPRPYEGNLALPALLRRSRLCLGQ